MEDENPRLPSDETLTVTLLSSEWKSSKGGLSTISRELAIQLAKHPNVEVYVYLPRCSEEDKKVAGSHSVQLIEAEELPGYEPIDWLTSLPKSHLPHCLIGHGLHLGRQIPAIKRHHDCKWVQVVHTAPEELGMYKSYEEAICKGERKHQAEVKLCELADQVVTVGPKLADAYSRYLRSSSKDQDVINLTPSIFTEFLNVKQATEERRTFCVLLFGRGDGEDFKLKGYDIAVQAVAELKDSSYHLMFVGAPAGKEDEVAGKLLQHGIPQSQLTVRRFMESREELAKLFCEVDLAIMPSRTEGFGLTALEALSAGLPVLVSGNSGLGDALKKVPSGFSHVVDSEDPKEWAKAINIVRQKGREVRLEEANLLREKYALKYSWQKQCECLVEKMLHLSFGNIQDKLEREQNQVENANEKVDNLEKLKKTSQEAAVKLKIDVEHMEPTEHSTHSDRTPVSTVESGASQSFEQHDAYVAPVSSGQNKPFYAEAPQAPMSFPTKEQVLCFIAAHFMQTTPPMNRDEYDYFRTYLEDIGAILTGTTTGSLLITVMCDSLQILERLWKDYLSGHLGEVIQRSFVTEEILTEFSLAELKLKTTISEEEYKACKACFEKDLSEENARTVLTTMSRPAQKSGKRLEDSKGKPPEHTIVIPNLRDLPRASKSSSLKIPIDILLVTVKDCEFLSCYAHLRNPFKCYIASLRTYVYFGQDAEMKIGLMRCHEASTGSESSLSAAVKNAIVALRPKGAIFVGYCSGLNMMKAKLGDVIVPVELTTYDHEIVLDGEEQFTGTRRLVSRRFLQLINHVADGWKAPLKSPKVEEVKVHSDGEILSGSEKIIADGRHDELVHLYPRAVAVEMEDEDLYTAAVDTGIQWLIVKGIADFAGGIKSTNFPWQPWQRFASVMAASVVFKFLSHANVFSDWPHYEESIKYRRDNDAMSAPVKYWTSITQAKLTDGIRQLYTAQEGSLTPFPWREEFEIHLDSISTTLQAVSRKETTGTMRADFVNMSGIFKPHEGCRQPRTVLIEGEPGTGKTTYCKKLAYNWATGKPWITGKSCTTGKQEEKDCFPRFETVLFLNCCDMKSDLWETIDCQLLPEDVEEHERKRFFSSIHQNKTNVLLVLDGLDEVAESKLPMISEIIEGKELRECRLVATARHEVGIRVRKHCDTLLKIKGFSKEDTKAFIFKYFQESEDKAKKLLSELTRDENLKDMAASTLNIALLCHVFEENHSNLPESRSQLYLDVTGCVLKRYNNKEGLPENNDVIDVYDAQLQHLGDIALKGLLKEKYDFEESELKSLAKKSPAFEFLSAQNGRRPSLRYSFPHRSFQEWFAGFFLYCQLIEKKISPESLVADKRYAHDLKEVLPYTCGLLAARCKVQDAVALAKCMMTEVNQGDRNGWLTLALECTRESKQKHSSFQATMAHELGSVLKLQTLEAHVGKRSAVNVFVLADVLKSNTTVIKLNLCDNDIDDAVASGVADALKSNKTLTALYLRDNKIHDAGAARLADALKCNKTLTELNLRGNGIRRDGAKALADALKSNKTLTELNLRDNIIRDAGAQDLADALKSNETLTDLNLRNNDVRDTGAANLADALKSNKTLAKLNLRNNIIRDAGAEGLADAMKSNETLTELNLRRNFICDAGAEGLADALKSNKTLTELNLGDNIICVSGAANLADALKSNKTLTELNLCHNFIGDAGAASLADALKSNNTLRELNLLCSIIRDNGAKRLADALKSNKTLTRLYLSGNYLGKDGLACLKRTLESNKKLTLDLFSL